MSNNHSTLFDSNTFYGAFQRDLSRARRLVIIESPFITIRRYRTLEPILQGLARRNVHTIINTKPLDELDFTMRAQSEIAIGSLQSLGVTVLVTVGHHRKLAIIDDIIWEGSLNILSQHDSCEMMRRVESSTESSRLQDFLGLHKWV